MTDFAAHLRRQIAWSRATFGPSDKEAGVIDHIKKELDEVRDSEIPAEEWVDVVILALDGLTRSLCYFNMMNTDEAAEAAVTMIVEKQGRNEMRVWPNWRAMPTDKAIEHDRSFDNNDEVPF